MANPKIYLGIDPDLRLLNCAMITSDKSPLGVFVRRNKGGKGDTAVAMAALTAKHLMEDVVRYFELNAPPPFCDLVLIVESQNMQQAVRSRRAGKRVDYEDILHTGQMAGIMIGVFSQISTDIRLVQPSAWKGQVPKQIHHRRIYDRLGFNDRPAHLEVYSGEKINAGDYMDINDSIGLALFGAEYGI